MKKRFSKILSVMMAIAILSVCFVVPVSAESSEPGVIQPRMTCHYCYSLTRTTCMGAPRVIEQTPHEYSGGTCYVVYYQCEGFEWCPSCYSNVYWYGWHDCYRVHGACGQGRINTCPCDYIPDVDL